MEKNENKKSGFTLVEMLAVVIVLSFIAIIVTPIIDGVLDDNKNRAYEDQISGIISSAKLWGTENIGKLPNADGESTSVTLEELQTGGYAKPNLKNPKTNDLFDAELTKVIITSENGILNYEVVFE